MNDKTEQSTEAEMIAKAIDLSGVPGPKDISTETNDAGEVVVTIVYSGDQRKLADTMFRILQKYISGSIISSVNSAAAGPETAMTFTYDTEEKGHGLDVQGDLTDDMFEDIKKRLRAAVSEAVIAFVQDDGTNLKVGETIGDEDLSGFKKIIVETVTKSLKDHCPDMNGVSHPVIEKETNSFCVHVTGATWRVAELFKFEMGTKIGDPIEG